jgi:polyhydroxybutyrate depolymerase
MHRRSRLLNVVSIFFVLLVACSQAGVMYGGPGATKNEQGKSPGPPGGVLDADYRVDLLWINEPGEYGPGDYGRWLGKSQGRDRFYIFHVPKGYKKGTAMPVVMVLHGGGGNPGVARFQSGMSDVADRENFIALYPAATNATYTDRLLYWNAGMTPKDKRQKDIDDVAYFNAVLDDLPKWFTIDPKRIYATGISNGAHMSYRLGTQLSNRIAAFAPVAAQRAVGEFYGPPSRPVSLIVFHGKKDGYLPYDGGPTYKSAFEDEMFKPEQECIATWAKHDGCEGAPATETKGNAHLQRWGGCKDGSEVELWTLDDGGHTWPGGKVTKLEAKGGIVPNPRASVGPVNKDINASQLMWEFFKRHPLP